MSAGRSVTATAPASIGNCAAGFDVLGQSLGGAADRVTASLADAPGVTIASIRCADAELPTDPARNTAGRAVQALLRAAGADAVGVRLAIDKGVPLASGMGGSAASAVAAVVAANALLDAPCDEAALYAAACAGEAAASGAPHGDNVAPSLLGGLVIAPRDGAPVRVPVPAGLHVALVHPAFALETRRSRVVLQQPFALADVTAQLEALALVLAGCHAGDLDLIRRGLRDVLAEPRRAPLIPGFDAVQRAALDAGALGASIAGGGPSVFGWFADRDAAARGGDAMRAAFAAAGLAGDVFVAPVDGPRAEVVA